MQISGIRALPLTRIDPANVRGDLSNDGDNPGPEAQLDVEYLMGLAPNSTSWFYSLADLNPFCTDNEGFLAWLYYVGMDEEAPLVQSLSYADEESSLFQCTGATDYTRRMDLEFVKMGVRGLTVIAASGDHGAMGPKLMDGLEVCGNPSPVWPASSAYVTSVGATMLSNKHIPGCARLYEYEMPLPVECSTKGEIACSALTGGLITSGGGFSQVNDRPYWQEAAVGQYLGYAKSLPQENDSGQPPFNTRGRAYPDVSAYGSMFLLQLEGIMTRESGTSASTPVVAAMCSLWNDMLLEQGKPTLGFLAPLLYQIWEHSPHAFNDITVGNNRCAVGHSYDMNCCMDSQAFHAAPGWDAVTGLGSLNFQVMTPIVLNGRRAGEDLAKLRQFPPEGEESPQAYQWVGYIGSAVVTAALALTLERIYRKSSRKGYTMLVCL
ncbi:unnamed protein product [Chrysoparadoxa australica]